MTLVGVPGIGKSRLVYELLQVVDASPELVVWRQGRSLPYGEGVTFWALGEMVKAQAGILETDARRRGRGEAARAVERSSPDERGAWVERTCARSSGSAPSADAGDRAARRSPPGGASSRRSPSERPLVLVFEDLHWADDGLLDFVDHLVDWASGVPLLVVCTARPELLERRPGWGGGKPNAPTLSLSPLSDDETARLIAALLERAVLPAETAVGAARARRRQPALRRAVRRACSTRARRATGDSRCPRPSRASSPPGSTGCRARRRRCSRTPP